MKELLLFAALVAMVSPLCVLGAQGQVETRSVWDGVYTEEQAKRGEAVAGDVGILVNAELILQAAQGLEGFLRRLAEQTDTGLDRIAQLLA